MKAEEPNPKPPETDANPPDPIPEPAAYFGEIPGLERVTDAIEHKPIKGGNVLLIVIDTLNAKHLGVYGHERDTSPKIDALARDGLVLTNYVTNCPWTRPSMATIMTGLPKAEHQMELNCPPLSDKFTTLAERFRAAGYRTGGFVGNPLVRAKWGFGQGFETYIDAEELDVHIIGRPNREYPAGVEPGVRAWTMAAYDSEIRYVDSQLKRLLTQLDKSEIRNKTTVVITADHGEMFGPHGCYTHTYHFWEPVLRVPFVIWSPGMSGRGIYEDRPFSHIDVAPTLLDLAGVEPSGPELVGVSIVESLTEPRVGRDRYLFGQYNAHGIRRETTRKGRWKLVHHHQVDSSALKSLTLFQGDPRAPPGKKDLPTLAWNGERYELYDLVSDPGENNNRFDERKSAPETAELMATILDFLEVEDAPPVELDTDLRQALEALGYFGTPADGP
ncbi:MAG: sulfatase [Deltaproteobacteria bacterium]|nr:sulfatase [Deltaproteobacteria bacterium]